MASQRSNEDLSLSNAASTRQNAAPIWRLPQELLDVIFELAFATDVPLSQRSYTKTRSLYLTSNTLNPKPVPSGTRSKSPAELSISMRWYHAALRSWLGAGTVEINPYTLQGLHNWPSSYLISITSIKFRAATRMDVVCPDWMTYPTSMQPPKNSEQRKQQKIYSYRRQVVQNSIREILTLCPNLLRLEMDMLDCVVGALNFGPIRRWNEISSEVQSSWKDLIFSHGIIQHLAITWNANPDQRAGVVLGRAQLVARYFNIMLKCRKHNTDVNDYRALARTIGYNEETEDASGIDPDMREQRNVLEVCAGFYKNLRTIPPDPLEDRGGYFFFFDAMCKVFRHQRRLRYERGHDL